MLNDITEHAVGLLCQAEWKKMDAHLTLRKLHPYHSASSEMQSVPGLHKVAH